MRQTTFSDMHCSLARSLDVIGDWWSPLILRDLFLGVNRFDELVEDLGISRNLLTSRLATLTEGGVIERAAYQQHPPRFEYRLTEAGLALVPVLLALMAWGDEWQTPEGGPPLVVADARTGHAIIPTVCNPDTGLPLSAADVSVAPGPGGQDAPGTRILAKRITAPLIPLDLR